MRPKKSSEGVGRQRRRAGAAKPCGTTSVGAARRRRAPAARRPAPAEWAKTRSARRRRWRRTGADPRGRLRVARVRGRVVDGHRVALPGIAGGDREPHVVGERVLDVDVLRPPARQRAPQPPAPRAAAQASRTRPPISRWRARPSSVSATKLAHRPRLVAELEVVVAGQQDDLAADVGEAAGEAGGVLDEPLAGEQDLAELGAHAGLALPLSLAPMPAGAAASPAASSASCRAASRRPRRRRRWPARRAAPAPRRSGMSTPIR